MGFWDDIAKKTGTNIKLTNGTTLTGSNSSASAVASLPTHADRVKEAMNKATNAVAAGGSIVGATPSPIVGGAAGAVVAGAAPKSTTTPTAVGNGGADYNAVDINKKKAMELDAARLKNDPAYRENEIKRTLAVIEQRKAQGLDVSAQEKYLTANLGYGVGGRSGEISVNPVIGQVGGNTPATPAPAAQPSNPGNETARNYIQELADARRQQTLAALEKSRQEALSNLQGEKAAIQPLYYDQRNRVAAGAQQQARNFAEFMAARGGTNSGANAQAELSRNMTTQGNLGTLGRQEAAALQDIERRTTGVNNAYASDKAAAEAGISGDQLQLMLDDYYRAQDRGDRLTQLAIENEFTRAGLTGYLNGQRTLAGQGLDLDREFGYADRLGTLGGQRTLAGLASDRDYEQQQWQNRFDYGNAIGQFGNGQQTMQAQQFAYQRARDQIADERYKAEFDEDVRRYGLDYAIRKAESTASIRNMEADNARMAANQSSGGSIGRPSTSSVIQDMSMPRTASTMETYIINNIPGGLKVAGPPSPDQLTAIENMILSNPNLSESDIIKLYEKFGIPLPE